MRIPKVSRRLQPQRRADRRARLPVGAGAVLALAVGWEWSLKMPLRATLGRGGGSPVCTDVDVEYVLVTKRGFALFSFFTDTCFSPSLTAESVCAFFSTFWDFVDDCWTFCGNGNGEWKESPLVGVVGWLAGRSSDSIVYSRALPDITLQRSGMRLGRFFLLNFI